MKKNIAVVGCGHWGKNLVRNFYELDVLGLICDPNIDIAEQFSKQYSVKNNSFTEIINDTDILTFERIMALKMDMLWA